MSGFATWLLENYADQPDTPLGKFAREFAPLLPNTDDCTDLRRSVEEHYADDEAWRDWSLACFDVAWSQYHPTCEWKGCTAPAAEAMSHCGEHATLGELL